MPFDYKKEYKDIYQPSKKPALIEVPPITYVAVRGKGDPNEEDGEYQRALQLLYGISFTIKMSPKSGHDIEGYAPYVVPPLEGFWTFPEPIEQLDPKRKAELEWISCIRLPEFVTPAVFDWAVQEVAHVLDDEQVVSETDGLDRILDHGHVDVAGPARPQLDGVNPRGRHLLGVHRRGDVALNDAYAQAFGKGVGRCRAETSSCPLRGFP